MMKNIITAINQAEHKVSHNQLESLGLQLRLGEIHAVISNSPTEIAGLWETLCTYQEHAILEPQLFGDLDFSAHDVRNKVCLLTNLFPTLSVFENIFMFEPSLYNQKRLVLKAQFKTMLKEYNLHINSHIMPKNLEPELNLLFSLLRVYVHKPCIVFIPEGLDRFIEHGYANTLEKLINNIKANGTCVVFFTSQYELAMLYSDRVSIIRNCKIITTNITSTVQRYPHDFMNIFMGWEFIGSQKGESNVDLVSVAPDVKDIASFNADLKNTLQRMCSDILSITHGKTCQILLTDKKMKIRRTSSYFDTPIDYFISESMIERFLNEKNMQPFILSQPDADEINNGTCFNGCFVCVPIKDSYGTSALILISYDHKISKISERDHALLINFAREISISIETSVLIGRSSLVQESHHRIKNSLQTIVSLVTLEKEKLINENLSEAVPVLTTIISRVKAIAIVHDLLSHQASSNNLMDLASILNSISESYRNVATLHFSLSNAIIPYNKALSIALVVNELLSNSVKHSMTKSHKLEIIIVCYQIDNIIYLSVTDNGIGFPKDFETAEHSGIGFDIIKNIVESLSGTLTFSYDNGAKTEISFPQSTVYII